MDGQSYQATEDDGYGSFHYDSSDVYDENECISDPVTIIEYPSSHTNSTSSPRGVQKPLRINVSFNLHDRNKATTKRGVSEGTRKRMSISDEIHRGGAQLNSVISTKNESPHISPSKHHHYQELRILHHHRFEDSKQSNTIDIIFNRCKSDFIPRAPTRRSSFHEEADKHSN